MTELEERVKRAERNNGFGSGVLVLTLSAVIVKIIGLVYKIPMLTLLGSEGMGYFNSAYEIYTLFGVVGAAGLPVAMSVMISGARERGGLTEKKIFAVAMTLFLVLGLAGTALMLAIAPLSELIFGSSEVTLCIVAISPAVFFICLTSVYRGFFQGLGRMRETAISQVIEAALKLIFGLLLAYIALRCGYGTSIVAAFGVLGLVASSAVSTLYLALSRRAYEKGSRALIAAESDRPRRQILKALLMTAIPISLSALAMNVTKIIDMTVMLRRMQDVGYSSAEAFSAYGSYTTLALPLFSLAPALISSVALPLVPSLSSSVARGDSVGQVRVVGDAVKLTMVISMPISVGLCLFSREILSLIFAGQESAVALTSPLLSVLALSIPLSSLITVSNATLQAYGRAGIPMISMVVGSLLKVVAAYFLIGNADVGIAGAPISTFLCDAVINLINWHFVGRCLPRVADSGRKKTHGGKQKGLPREVALGAVTKPFFASFISVAAVRIIYSAISARAGESRLLTIITIGFCAVIYLPISLAVGVIDRGQMKNLLRRGGKVK